MVDANLTNCEGLVSKLNGSLSDLQTQYDACGCGADPCAGQAFDPVDFDLGLHIGAVFIILGCSLLGVMLPLLSRRMHLQEYPIILGKFFGCGIIFACALVHMLQPANESLTSECLGWEFAVDYPAYAYLFSIIAIFAMHSIERGFRAFLHSRQPAGAAVNAEADVEKADSAEDTASIMDIRIQAYMLEFGFTVHSVFIGLAVGVETDNLASLLTALSFHQFFEGVGLGSRLSDKGIRTVDAIILGVIFAIAAPLGIMVGAIVTSQVQPSGMTYSLVEGIFDALCSGILLYVGFILLFEDFPRDMKLHSVGNHAMKKAFGIYFAMWLGGGLMSFVGKYL